MHRRSRIDMPKISLIIPTRTRLETLQVTLESAIAQPSADIEILVVDNASTDGTPEYLKTITDPRVVTIRSEQPLSMQQNWMRALKHAKGEWITIIGDDDAFMPAFVETANTAISADKDNELIHWPGPNYRWPSFPGEHERNRMLFNIGTRIFWVDSQEKLRRVYTAFEDPYGTPSVYHTLVKRSLIERIEQTLGEYPLSVSPDLGSGVVNLAFTKRHMRLEWPLTVFGYSGTSTGAAIKYTKPGSVERADFLKLETEFDELRRRIPLPGLDTTESYVYQILQGMRPWLSMVGMNMNVDMKLFVHWQISRLGLVHPEQRLQTIDSVKALCVQHGITDVKFPDTITSDPVGAGNQAAFFKVAKDGSGSVSGRFDFTGTPVVNVYQAACILRSMVPQIS